MKKVTVSARTVEEAIQKALAELKATREQVKVNVLEEPSKGFLGLIGGRPATVEVEVAVDPAEKGRLFLAEVLDKMGVIASVDVESRAGSISYRLHGEDLGLVIGRRGQTLDALQVLLNTVVNRHSREYLHAVLDAENYREKRKKALEELAERLAAKVARTRKSVRLEPMTAMERKIIHTKLQNHSHVVTHSEGEEPNRYVVISYKD